MRDRTTTPWHADVDPVQWLRDQTLAHVTDDLDSPRERERTAQSAVELAFAAAHEFLERRRDDDAGDLVDTVVRINSADGSSHGDSFEDELTPTSLLAVCAMLCDTGDEVIVLRRYRGGHAAAARGVWPFSYPTALAMLTPRARVDEARARLPRRGRAVAAAAAAAVVGGLAGASWRARR